MFVTVGIALKDYTFLSMLQVTWLMMLKNVLQPVWLGGVPRKYIRVMALVTQERLQELQRLVEEGKLKVSVDSIWEMEDVQKVRTMKLRNYLFTPLIITLLGIQVGAREESER